MNRDSQQKARGTCFEKRECSHTYRTRPTTGVMIQKHNAILDANVAVNGTERIPLVLTYIQPSHQKDPHGSSATLTMLWQHKWSYETTKEIFLLSPPQPLTSYRRDQNIRDIFVDTSMRSQSVSRAGAYPCDAPWCRVLIYQPLISSKDHDTTSPSYKGNTSPVNLAMSCTAHAQWTHRWTPSNHYKRPTRFPRCGIFSHAWTRTREQA